MKTLKIATHEGISHSDEVFAIALIKEVYENIEVTRLSHQTEEFRGFDLVVDIGRKYDGDKYLDHHQDLEIEVSNMLVLQMLRDKGVIRDFEYKALEPLYKKISEFDRGMGEVEVDSIVDFISSFNSDDVYSEEQYGCFLEALDCAQGYVHRILERARKLEANKEKLSACKEVKHGILEMPEYIQGWETIIFDIPKLDKIDIVVWYDKNQNTWKIQQVPDAPGSFGRRGRKIVKLDPLPDGCQFLHAGEFFGVFETREALLKYVGENLE